MSLPQPPAFRALLLLGLLGLSSLRLAAQFTITDFSAATGLTYNGNASVSGATAIITPALGSQKGSVYVNTPQSIAGDFTASLTFTLQNTNYGINGADGIALVFQNSAAGVNALGSGGDSLGIFGGGTAVYPLMAVSVQTFDANETRLFVNSSSPSFSSATTSAVGPMFGDLTLSAHTLSLSYTEATKLLVLKLDGVQQFSYTLGSSLSTLLGGSTALVGFSGATGTVSALQSATNFSFSAVPEPSTISLIAVGATLVGWRMIRRKRVRSEQV